MLHLYKGILPNTDYKHYYFTNTSRYLSFLSTYLVKSITLDNYRINSNIIKVKLDNTLTAWEAINLSYVIDDRYEDNVQTYFRAYFVNRIDIVSGYAVLTCSVDLWASYLFRANSNILYVERTNKSLGVTPIYDDIKAVLPSEYKTSVDSNGAANGMATPDTSVYQYAYRYYLVLVINYNAKQNLTGSDYIATTCCMGIRLDTLRNAYIDGIDPSTTDPAQQELLSMSVIRIAQDFAGGVYGISASLGHNDANVVEAYIVRDHAVSRTSVVTGLKSISLLKGGADLSINASILSYSDYQETLYVRNISPNNVYYFGKVHGGLKLNRAFNDLYNHNYTEVIVRFIVSASNVEVIAIQGNNQEDITEAFKLTITNNVSQTTPLRRIAGAITQTGRATQAITKGYKNSGATGAVGAGLTSLASMVGDFSIDSKIRGDGDALHTFMGVADLVVVPFHATYYTSLDNEERKAYLYGASCDVEANIYWVIQQGFLISGQPNKITYVKGTLYIEDLPKDATEYIKNKFASGVYLVDLVTP